MLVEVVGVVGVVGVAMSRSSGTDQREERMTLSQMEVSKAKGRAASPDHTWLEREGGGGMIGDKGVRGCMRGCGKDVCVRGRGERVMRRELRVCVMRGCVL